MEDFTKGEKLNEIYNNISYLSELLGICKIINSNGQEHIEEGVWLFMFSGKHQRIDKHRISIYRSS